MHPLGTAGQGGYHKWPAAYEKFMSQYSTMFG